MIDIFRRKNKLERLKVRYASLMRQSYEKALFNKEESEELQLKAMNIREEIAQLSFTYAEI